jgi:hypothetical protein
MGNKLNLSSFSLGHLRKCMNNRNYGTMSDFHVSVLSRQHLVIIRLEVTVQRHFVLSQEPQNLTA